MITGTSRAMPHYRHLTTSEKEIVVLHQCVSYLILSKYKLDGDSNGSLKQTFCCCYVSRNREGLSIKKTIKQVTFQGVREGLLCVNNKNDALRNNLQENTHSEILNGISYSLETKRLTIRDI